MSGSNEALSPEVHPSRVRRLDCLQLREGMPRFRGDSGDTYRMTSFEVNDARLEEKLHAPRSVLGKSRGTKEECHRLRLSTSDVGDCGVLPRFVLEAPNTVEV